MHLWRHDEADWIQPDGHFGGLRVSDVVPRHAGGNFVVQQSVAPPKSGGESHVHDHDHQLFLMIKGSLTFDTGDNRFTLSAGEGVLFHAGEPHATLNQGEEESIAVVVTVKAQSEIEDLEAVKA